MSKKYFYLAAVTVAVFLVSVGVIFANGSAETTPGAGSAGEASPGADGRADARTAAEPAVRPPIPGAGTLEEAIAAATAVPASWDYDPRARLIFQEGAGIDYPLQVDESVWASRLDPFEYYVLREKGTERAFASEMNSYKDRGIYYSRATGQPLFSSADKYDSGSGWPSFTRPINPDAIVYVDDSSLFMRRIEVVDSLSGSHLGHVFPDGPAPTGQRYCINGASLIFVPEGQEPPPFLAELRALAQSTGQ